jgi:hypothetical protein
MLQKVGKRSPGTSVQCCELVRLPLNFVVGQFAALQSGRFRGANLVAGVCARPAGRKETVVRRLGRRAHLS